jgi:hypothetical protein
MIRLILAGLLVLTLGAAAPAGAHHGDVPLRPAGKAVHGLSPSEWLGRWWEVVYETPSPFERYPGCAPLGRRVVAPVMPPGDNEATCTVVKGTTLALVPDTASCNDYEPPPLFGDTPRERRLCSIRLEDGVELVEVTVDGVRVRLTGAFRTSAPDGRARLPEDNLLGAPAGTRIRYGANGWIAFTRPLSRGRHEIVLHGAGTYLGELYESFGRFHILAV